MNLGTDLSRENQELLQELGITVENRNYSKDEIKLFLFTNDIGDFIFSKSSKNGDMEKALDKFSDILNIFVRNK